MPCHGIDGARAALTTPSDRSPCHSQLRERSATLSLDVVRLVRSRLQLLRQHAECRYVRKAYHVDRRARR